MGRRVRVTLGIAVALGVALVIALPWIADADRHRPRLESLIEESTGWQVQLGELQLSVLQGLELRADSTSLVAGPDSSRIDVDRIVVTSSIWPLLRGKLDVRSIELVQPRIVLVRESFDGGWVVPFAEKQDAGPVDDSGEGRAPAALEVAIGSVRVSKGSLAFRDMAGETPLSLALEAVTFELDPLTRTFVGGAALDAGGQAMWNGEVGGSVAIALQGLHTDALQPWLSGVLHPGGKLDGDVEIDWPTIRGTVVGRQLSLLEAAETVEQARLEVDLRTADGRWQLERLDAQVGEVAVSASGPLYPIVDLELQVDSAPLAAVMQLARATLGVELPVEPPGELSAALNLRHDASGQLVYSAEGRVTAARFDPGDPLPPVLNIDAPFRLTTDGRLSLEPLAGTVASGRLSGRVTLDRVVPQGVLRFEGRVERAALGELLSSLTAAQAGEIKGPVNLDLDVAIDLSRVDQGLAALGGQVSLDANSLTMNGWDLGGVLSETLREKLGGLGALLSLVDRERESRGVPEGKRLLDRMRARLVFDTLPWKVTDVALNAGGLSAAGAGAFDPLAARVEMALILSVDAQHSAELIEGDRRLKLLADDRGRLQMPLSVSGAVDRPALKVELGDLAGEARDQAIDGLLRNLLDR